MRAVAYCRISSDRTGQELGVQRQEARIRELCERDDIELAHIYVDNDTSAYGRKRRDGFDAMLAAVADPEIDVVIGWAVDRLTRNMRTGEDLIDAIVASKVRVMLVNNGEIDLNTSQGRMTFRMLCAIATQESEGKSDRIRSKHRELLETGAVGGGGTYRPFGYADDRITIVPAEAAMLRDAAARVVAGESMASIARSFAESGVTTTSGRQWEVTALKGVLLSPRIVGQRADAASGKRWAAVWDAIITDDEQRQIAAVLNDPSRAAPRGRVPFMLTGILRCSACGFPMNGGRAGKSGHRRRVYACRSTPNTARCGRIIIDAVKTEAFIVETVQARLANGGLARLADSIKTVGDDSADLAELTRIEIELEDLGKMFAQPGASKAMLMAASAELEALRMACNDRLRSSAAHRARLAVRATQARIGSAWPEAPEAQRALMREMVAAVEVGPHQTPGAFDQTRISIPAGAWRV